jgi:protein gp37
MGANSKIEWCDHTFNPWIGCQKVSAGCLHCYAESLAKRTGLAVWGAEGTRRVTSDAYWRLPIQWARQAQKDGQRRRVFCASLADVLELREGLAEPRARLWNLIEATRYALDWLILTKRPENFFLIPPNLVPFLWLGVACEDQAAADVRLERLLVTAAAVHFVSVEPMLGPIGLRSVFPWKLVVTESGVPRYKAPLDWVICGGESGPGARPMQAEWARSLRDHCQSAGVAFFFKQWGEFLGAGQDGAARDRGAQVLNCDREPIRVGKRTAGRLLDGREWNEFPEVRQIP